MCAVAACCVVPAISDGSSERRGGNHGCGPGTIFSDHWFEPGDNISFGYHFQTGTGPPPGNADQDNFFSRNVSSEGGPASSNSCTVDVGAITSVETSLGAGDDSVRLDGKGVPPDEEGAFGKVPKATDSLLKGGAGDDTIRGHKGFDNINAGADDDVVKADDGKKDTVKCGPGEDKADVDSKDDVSGCEKLT
ncbi:MAG: hypothetical protein QOI31_2249 [Solirubrobacterales bacterium]|nr:hypothetical protein [Solirubrobacterales bacterium]